MRVNTLVSGLVLAAVAAGAVLVGDGLGWDLYRAALLGAGIGGAVGLIADSTPVGRLVGVLLGIVLGFAALGVRALYLPDTITGWALYAVIAIVVVTGVAVATGDRLPLWSLLLGLAAMAGSYETIYRNSPSDFLTTAPVAFSTVFATTSLGFAATALVSAMRAPKASGSPAATEDTMAMARQA